MVATFAPTKRKICCTNNDRQDKTCARASFCLGKAASEATSAENISPSIYPEIPGSLKKKVQVKVSQFHERNV